MTVFAAVLTLVVIPAVGGVLVWFVARVLRWRFPQLTLTASLVGAHTILLLACIVLYPTGVFFPDIPFDDLYLAYYLFPGTHIYFAIEKLLVGPLMPLIFRIMSSRVASLVGIVFLPGLFGLVVGGMQWYLIGRAVTRIRSRRLEHSQASLPNVV